MKLLRGILSGLLITAAAVLLVWLVARDAHGGGLGCCSGRDLMLKAADRAVALLDAGKGAEARKVLDQARRQAREE